VALPPASAEGPPPSQLAIRRLVGELENAGGAPPLASAVADDDEDIDFSEILCCRCAAADCSDHNDILLCDGACNRAFHQQCLDPPLATKDSTDPSTHACFIPFFMRGSGCLCGDADAHC
jgi:hypothetical protein